MGHGGGQSAQEKLADGEAAGAHVRGHRPPYPAEVPGLVGVPRHVLLPLRVAEDETEFVRVLGQPPAFGVCPNVSASS